MLVVFLYSLRPPYNCFDHTLKTAALQYGFQLSKRYFIFKIRLILRNYLNYVGFGLGWFKQVWRLYKTKWLLYFCRKYPEGWSTDPGRDSQLEYRLSIYHAAKDDSGTFTCLTPTRHTHSVEIVVKGKH